MQGQLAKHVGCEISGRLDKIHPERENKVRSNELWLTRAVGASKPSPQMQMLNVTYLDGLLKTLCSVTAWKEGRWNSALSFAVLQRPETQKKCSAWETSLSFYRRGTYCTGIQNKLYSVLLISMYSSCRFFKVIIYKVIYSEIRKC